MDTSHNCKQHCHLYWLGIIFLIGITIGFTYGRFSAEEKTSIPNESEIKADELRFLHLVDAIKSYVLHSNGEIPSDPYFALIQSKTIKDFDSFWFEDGVIEFGWRTLPPRIHTNFARNAHVPFFWLSASKARELWVCYLDGNWTKIPYGNPDVFTKQQMEWYKLFKDRGNYPVWFTMAEKRQWIDEHQDTLEWDERGKFYVFRRK
jgi:hypothetical protein